MRSQPSKNPTPTGINPIRDRQIFNRNLAGFGYIPDPRGIHFAKLALSKIKTKRTRGFYQDCLLLWRVSKDTL